MKEILIINGSGGVGKDTFVDCLGKVVKTSHISIVTPTKNIAKLVGWDNDKSEKGRRFLCDLKTLIDDYNDYNYNYVTEEVREFMAQQEGDSILCIDMREKEQIERAKKEFNAKTVLVTRTSVPQITSNIADAGVFDLQYDYHIRNDGSLDDLQEKARKFIDLLKHNEYEKVVYISHPYGGSIKNKQKVEHIISDLRKHFPNYLFLSPVHAFGLGYDAVSYEDGINECLWLLKKADEMWVFGDYANSSGCQAEIFYCQTEDIPYKFKEEIW